MTSGFNIRIFKELTVLLVEDEDLLRKTTGKFLSKIFKTVYLAENGVAGIEAFKKQNPDIVITDIKMPVLDGLKMAKELKKINKSIPIIVTTAYSKTEHLIESIEIGVDRFVKKPFERDTLLEALYKCSIPIIQENNIQKYSSTISNSLINRIGSSKKMKKVIDGVEKVAKTDFSVILQGETGVGKTLIAGIIHELSPRSKNPFVTLDIGSIPKDLIESELFGHKKGAFTDAHIDKTGYLEAANGGTIFLEELENVGKEAQAKLLRAVEEKKIYPLGSTIPVPTDFRIIAATNIDIKKIVERKDFREDLYYRLFEFEIMIPPLRERIEEIEELANKFFLDANKELNKKIRYINNDAYRMLEKNSWHGNIRELNNMIRRAVLICKEEYLSKRDIMSVINDLNVKSTNVDKTNITTEKNTLDDIIGLEEIEKQHILNVLKLTNWNRMKTASLLKINYQRLFRKIKKYNIDSN